MCPHMYINKLCTPPVHNHLDLPSLLYTYSVHKYPDLPSLYMKICCSVQCCSEHLNFSLEFGKLKVNCLVVQQWGSKRLRWRMTFSKNKFGLKSKILLKILLLTKMMWAVIRERKVFTISISKIQFPQIIKRLLIRI